MLVNIIRNIKMSSRMFVIFLNNQYRDMFKIQCMVCGHCKKCLKCFFPNTSSKFRESLSKFSMIWQSVMQTKNVNQKPANLSREENRCIYNILV